MQRWGRRCKSVTTAITVIAEEAKVGQPVGMFIRPDTGHKAIVFGQEKRSL